MRPFVPFLAAFLLFACSQESSAPAVEVHRSRDLVVLSRELPAETAFAVVGLRTEPARDDGAADWDWDFGDRQLEIRAGVARREFRLTVRNRGATVRELHARIEYFGSGEMLRRRTLDNLVVPPFTERTWIGSVSLASSVEPSPLVRVLPRTEPFEEEPPPNGALK
ncbi:MAG: hypothetical protein ACRD2J_06595 [Thermoanaerobaculia bacterium]